MPSYPQVKLCPFRLFALTVLVIGAVLKNWFARRDPSRRHRQLEKLRGFKRNVRILTGVDAINRGDQGASTTAFVSRQLAAYHRRKILDPNFHHGPRGGDKWRKFSAADAAWIEVNMWRIVSSDPSLTVARIRAQLLLQRDREHRATPQSVSCTYILDIFHKWHWRFELCFFCFHHGF